DRPPRSGLLGPLPGLVDSVVLTGDDDLAGAVVVRGPDAENLAAEALDGLVLEPEDGRHRSRAFLRRFGHGEAALADERDRLADRHGPGRSEGRELADGMADDEVRDD